MTSPFNSYDENNRRVTVTGASSTKLEDEAIIRNLRFAFKEELKDYSDVAIVNMYDEFAMSEMFGDNDERFLEWLKDYE